MVLTRERGRKGERARVRLTKRVIDAATVGAKQVFVWDSVIRGFALRVMPSGVKSYILQYRPATGGRKALSRRYTIGKHGSPWTAETARAEAERLLIEIKLGKDPATAKKAQRTAPTINDLCDQYLDEGVAHKKVSTLRVDKGRIECHIRPLLGRKKVAELSQADVERFLLDVKTGKTAASAPEGERKRKNGSSARGGSGVAAQCVILLGTMLSFAIGRGMRVDNPAHGVKKPKVRKMERFLSGTEIEALGKAIRDYEDNGGNPYIAAAIRLLLLTGCRKGELFSLKWQAVDIDRASIILDDSKTGRKPIYLNQPAVDILKSIPRVTNNPFVIVGAKHGSHLVNIDKTWVLIRELAGLNGLRLHDLRHSFASVAADIGMSLPIIGALLGHKETSTTARYAHLAADPLRAANEAIGAQIAASLKPKVAPRKSRIGDRLKVASAKHMRPRRLRAKRTTGKNALR